MVRVKDVAEEIAEVRVEVVDRESVINGQGRGCGRGNGRRSGRGHRPQPHRDYDPYDRDDRVMSLVKIEAPSFDSQLDPRVFFDWMADMDHFFEWYNMSEGRKV